MCTDADTVHCQTYISPVPEQCLQCYVFSVNSLCESLSTSSGKSLNEHKVVVIMTICFKDSSVCEDLILDKKEKH